MVSKSVSKRAFAIALIAVFAVGVLVMAGCACSSSSPSSSSSSSVSAASSSSSVSSSSRSASSSASASSSSASNAATVPNVVSLSQAEAEKSIEGSGLVIGQVKREPSDTVAADLVISQDPQAHAAVKAGDAVNIVVSSGKAEPKDVQVPNLWNMTQPEAEKALSDLKLISVASNPEETTEVEAGHVFKQSIEAGATVKEGEKVAFTVAVAPSKQEVPDVTGKTREEAKKAIEDAKLSFDSYTEYNNDVAENRVIWQSVAAGEKVNPGTMVSVAVSLGPEPVSTVKVPNVIGMTRSEAKEALSDAGLKHSFEGDKNGNAESQDIAAGTVVEKGTTVVVAFAKVEEQNPLMNYVGEYSNGRGTVTVEAREGAKGKVVVEWSSSAAEVSRWTMTGNFNSETNTLEYSNCTKINFTYGENGKVANKKTVYTDGSGVFKFRDKGGLSLAWQDDKEHIADGETFTYIS